MAWQIESLPQAAKELSKLDRTVAARIVRTLEERIATLDDPRTIGSALVGEHAGFWRWRIGGRCIVRRRRPPPNEVLNRAPHDLRAARPTTPVAP